MSLVRLVRQYARESHHRSGTDAETRTREWLLAELAARGLATRPVQFEFQRYAADWRLDIGAREVEAIPLFHCAEGRFDLRGARPHRLVPDHWDEASTLRRIETLVDAERRRGASALALATDTPDGRVSAINVACDYSLDFPVMLFGARDLQIDAAVSGYLRAGRQTARSLSIVGNTDGPVELILTTAYTGWFGCAAERGAGLALLLGLVSRLADRVRLAVVITSGHEHHHLGASAVREQETFAPGIPVLHLGSCIASREGCCRVTHNLGTQAPERCFTAKRFELRGLSLSAPPSEWAGEAADWIDGQRPVLSLSGIDRHFHTPADTADRVDAAALEATLAALEQASVAIFAARAATITRQK